MRTGVIYTLAFIVLANGQSGIHAEWSHGSEIASVNPYKHLLRVRSLDDIRTCEPGATKKQDCNDCFCTPNGWGWACTRRGCSTLVVQYAKNPAAQPDEGKPSERVERDADDTFSCVPDSVFLNDCNWCTCTRDGRGAMCTLMACPPKDRVRQISQPKTTA